jgi:hypothetical protein
MDISKCTGVSQLIDLSISGERHWVVALSNLDIPVEDLIASMSTLTVAIQERLAEHPDTVPEVLGLLACSEDSEVRAAVSENPNASHSLLQKLVADESADVRFRLAENPNIPQELLSILLEDDNSYVACRAKRTLDRLAPPRSERAEVFNMRVSGNRNASAG